MDPNAADKPCLESFAATKSRRPLQADGSLRSENFGFHKTIHMTTTMPANQFHRSQCWNDWQMTSLTTCISISIQTTALPRGPFSKEKQPWLYTIHDQITPISLALHSPPGPCRRLRPLLLAPTTRQSPPKPPKTHPMRHRYRNARCRCRSRAMSPHP
jgi:hypothetical protein